MNPLQPENSHDEMSQVTRDALMSNLQMSTTHGVAALIESESTGEELVAYAQLLSLTRKGPTESLIQEQNPLYDKVFYKAKSIEKNPDGTYVIVTEDAFVKLNDKVAAGDIATVGELRNKSKEGILFSGVGALTIMTRDGVRIPLLRRDSGAPTDAGKYTLPAGRADKSPGLTAYEECLEEIIILARKNGKLEIVVPYIEGAGISEGKAKLLVQLARGRYLTKVLNTHVNMAEGTFQEILKAPIVLRTASLGKGESVKTIFETGVSDTFAPQCIEEGGMHPYHDAAVNTFEFIRSIKIDLREYEDITIADGDGFGRAAGLFSPEAVEALVENGETVASLKGAQELGVFSVADHEVSLFFVK